MTYPIRTGGKPTPQDTALNERARSQTGLNSTPDKEAVTRGDVSALGVIALKSSKLTAAPTASDYNNLVDDMRALATLLNAMGAKFTGL